MIIFQHLSTSSPTRFSFCFHVSAEPDFENMTDLEHLPELGVELLMSASKTQWKSRFGELGSYEACHCEPKSKSHSLFSELLQSRLQSA